MYVHYSVHYQKSKWLKHLLFCFFYLISKTNLSIMSIKPSVVFIKGVHSTTGSDKTSDIGFPDSAWRMQFEPWETCKKGILNCFEQMLNCLKLVLKNNIIVVQCNYKQLQGGVICQILWFK